MGTGHLWLHLCLLWPPLQDEESHVTQHAEHRRRQSCCWDSGEGHVAQGLGGGRGLRERDKLWATGAEVQTPLCHPQLPKWHLSKAPRTLSTSTQDLSPQ